MQGHLSQIAIHMAMCKGASKIVAKGNSPISVMTEKICYGIASVFLVKCKACDTQFTLNTSPRLKTEKSNHFDINVRAVWGSMVTGNGASHLNEMLGVMNCPGLKPNTFSNIENEISQWWKASLEDEMKAAGAEERRLAIEANSYHEGVPAITVIADGGWSKRSHKHSYNASGGVGIIIGKQTGKILFIGIRNKYCYICNKANTQKIDPLPHTCFKNWSNSSQAMESDIIVEGFKEAERIHGVRYMTLIADGDSSVYAHIQEEVPIWGKHVSKLECSNHVCKCLRSSLEKLVADNPLYKGAHKLSKSIRMRITSAVRCAIRMRSTNTDRKIASKLLAHDIKNSIHHIFGNHSNCSDFCKAKEKNVINAHDFIGNPTTNTDENDEVDQVLNSQSLFWTEGTSIECQEQSRQASGLNYTDLDKYMLEDISILLNRVAAKSDRLLENTTTNLAEAWMHMRCKFDGGKVTNLCNRGSWHARCYGAAVRQNLGPRWATQVWETATATSSGHNFNILYDRRERHLKNTIKSLAKPEQHARRWKRKMNRAIESQNKKAKLEYGPEALDVVDDLCKEDLEMAEKDYLRKHINISNQQIDNLSNQTLEQSRSQIWISERKKRLTSSNFGKIVKRNPKMKCTPIIQNLLYSNFKGNQHTLKGQQEERNTIIEYQLEKAKNGVNVIVEKMGLVVDKENKFLGTSPDGKVKEINSGETGLVELKNLLHNKPLSLNDAADMQKSFCLEKKNGRLQLKKNHDYYYQCQGQLNITGLPWLDFIVRTSNPYQIHIERIFRDIGLWNNTMLPKLTAFYMKVLLPELAVPRHKKSPGIREPGLWVCSKVHQWKTNYH